VWEVNCKPKLSGVVMKNEVDIILSPTASLISNDNLWVVDGNSLRSTRLAQVEFESGRNIDVIGMSINKEESSLYFRNKLDNTLWQYELPQ
jgi:hypothetical protein